MMKFVGALFLFLLAFALAGPLGVLVMILVLALLAGGLWFTGDLMKIAKDWASLIREHRERRSP